MMNQVVSAQMGSWQGAAARSDFSGPEDPVLRYRTANAVVERLRQEVQALIDKATAAGFALTEALAIPTIRQRLLAAREALLELKLAYKLLAA